MPSYTETWDETKPAGSRDRSLGDDDIREFKRAIRERLAQDHEMYADESGEDFVGYHTKVTIKKRTGNETSVTDAVVIFVKSDGSTDELFMIDESGNVIQLTDAGVLAVLGSEGWRSGDMLISSNTNTPTGWSDVSTTYDNKFIRITDGTPLTTGGSDTHDHGGATASHTLTESEIPAHTHTQTSPTGGDSGSSAFGYDSAENNSGAQADANATQSKGGGGGHSHNISSANNVPAYIELRMYQKD